MCCEVIDLVAAEDRARFFEQKSNDSVGAQSRICVAIFAQLVLVNTYVVAAVAHDGARVLNSRSQCRVIAKIYGE